MKLHRYAVTMMPQPPWKECVLMQFRCRRENGMSTFLGNAGRETARGTSLAHQTAMMSPRQKTQRTRGLKANATGAFGLAASRAAARAQSPGQPVPWSLTVVIRALDPAWAISTRSAGGAYSPRGCSSRISHSGYPGGAAENHDDPLSPTDGGKND